MFLNTQKLETDTLLIWYKTQPGAFKTLVFGESSETASVKFDFNLDGVICSELNSLLLNGLTV